MWLRAGLVNWLSSWMDGWHLRTRRKESAPNNGCSLRLIVTKGWPEVWCCGGHERKWTWNCRFVSFDESAVIGTWLSCWKLCLKLADSVGLNLKAWCFICNVCSVHVDVLVERFCWNKCWNASRTIRNTVSKVTGQTPTLKVLYVLVYWHCCRNCYESNVPSH